MKKQNTRRALLMSALSILLCVSMLVGTTFAWFTDEVKSGKNQIVAGNLDIELEYKKVVNGVATDWAPVAGKADIFDPNALWEPGRVEVVYLKVSNLGTLALKYQLGVNVYNEITGLTEDNKVIKLSDHLVFKVVEMPNALTTYTDREAVKLAAGTEKGLKDYNGQTTALDPKSDDPLVNDEDYLALIVYMPETVGNEANYRGTAVPTIELGINLFATQYTAEKDSFNEFYDELASMSGSVTAPAPALGETKTYDVMDNLGQKLMASFTIPGEAVEDVTAPVSISIIPTELNANVTVENHQNGATFDITVSNLKENNLTAIDVDLFVGKGLAGVKIFHYGTELSGVTYDPDTGFATFQATDFSPYTVVFDKPVATIGDNAYSTIYAAFAAAQDGDEIVLRAGYNTQDAQLTETIMVTKKVTLVNNGMYLVSAAPATFTVAEGGKLTVTEGSFTIKNTSSNGASVLLDGGEFVMEGGSFDAYAAVRTTAGKSSTATLAAGWSNRVTVGFDCLGNDTVNITGGSLYTGKEGIKTVAGTHLTFNMSGGLLSGKTNNMSATVLLKGTATINVTGGKIEATYVSGLNGSAAIEANAAPTTINISGDAVISGKGWGITLGDHWSPPAVQEERFTLNVSGNASVTADGDTGFGIRYCQDACDVTISGNAKVSAKFHAIQMNSNSYLFVNSTLTIAENATITSTAGRYGGGYAVAAYGKVTITGGTITGSNVGLAALGNSVVVIDNSTSGTPITINKADIGADVDYTVAGNPTIG